MTSPFQNLSAAIKDQSQAIIDHGLNQGADRVKCVGSCGQKSRLVVESGEFTLADTITSQGLGVMIHKDQRKGSANTNASSLPELQKTVDQAIALASFSIEDSFLTMADSVQAPPAASLRFLADWDMESIGLDQLGEVMKEVLATFKKHPQFALDRFELAVDLGYHRLTNSLGVAQEEYQTAIHWYYMGMARDQDHVSGMDYEGDFSFGWQGVKDKIQGGVESFIARVMGQLHPRKCPGYRGPILLSPRAVHQLLVSPLLFHSSGRSVMDGKSLWADAVGKLVTSNELNIFDSPHDSRLSGATAYDADGLPTKRRALIEQGILTDHNMDCYSAKKLKRSANGMAGGPFAIEISPGSNQESELLKARDGLLYVDRFSGNVDALTGDFSGVAKSSQVYNQDGSHHPVGETMIAGNTLDLAKKILALGNQVHCVSGSYLSPLVLVDDVTVS